MALIVGLVRMRGIGMSHAECYAKDSLAKLVAVCDVIEDRANAAGEKFDVKAYHRFKDMVEAHPDGPGYH